MALPPYSVSTPTRLCILLYDILLLRSRFSRVSISGVLGTWTVSAELILGKWTTDKDKTGAKYAETGNDRTRKS